MNGAGWLKIYLLVCHHQFPCVKLLAFDSMDTGRKFLACAEKVRPSFVVTNHLLDVIQTLSQSQPIHTMIHLRRIYNFLLFDANIIQLSYTFGNFLYYFWD